MTSEWPEARRYEVAAPSSHHRFEAPSECIRPLRNKEEVECSLWLDGSNSYTPTGLGRTSGSYYIIKHVYHGIYTLLSCHHRTVRISHGWNTMVPVRFRSSRWLRTLLGLIPFLIQTNLIPPCGGLQNKNAKVSCRIVIHEPLCQSLANGLINPPYQRFVLTPTSERVTMFLPRCARPFLRHWAERGSLPLKSSRCKYVSSNDYFVRFKFSPMAHYMSSGPGTLT